MLLSRKQSKPRFMSQPTFDEVVVGEGESQRRLDFEQFCRLPLNERVAFLMQQPRYYRDGKLINGREAMSFR